METFTKIKDFVDNPAFGNQRKKSLKALNIESIDRPIRDIITHFARLSYCFTMQSCFGHFVHKFQKDTFNTEPIAKSDKIFKVEYRIAYIAFCIEKSELGSALFTGLKNIPKLEENYIQFGCAGWFWQRQVNSYALQVEPKRFMDKDKIQLDYHEALYIEKTRNRFFAELRKMIQELHLI